MFHRPGGEGDHQAGGGEHQRHPGHQRVGDLGGGAESALPHQSDRLAGWHAREREQDRPDGERGDDR